ncbi:AraC family transcriptional regulator [Steroidobacter agaridevorans]|uniref:AraC family transcriptional regulator n=1 Tax=Steroidobacter agaridevorans TaxID=2695856 RepID=A0A829YN39_9GAMM|nr:helix-turn-helix domain-containing protein [Steroidobacter agaridevorans]GFE84757.1 AraC family transcriptional regulator [Steroidobacter agaridevorans]
MRTVLFALLPEVVLLDVAGAAEAFRLASLLVPDSYDLQFVGTSASLRSAVGLQLHKLQRLPAEVPDHSIVVVTGVTSAAFDLESEPFQQLSQWLQVVARNETVTLMCVCSGSLMAAHAGLLRGRECTTHHDLIGKLEKLEPSATVHGNRIFVEDGHIMTSAGVTSGVDLALHLIGQQLGHKIAVAVARDLVVYMRRTTADPQLSAWVMHRNHIHPAVHKVQDAIARNPAAEWTASKLAAVACMSARNLGRLFAEHAECSPLDYVQRLRVAVAREMVMNSDLALERVAERSGFSSAHHLRRVWRRWERASPAEFRSTGR